MKRLLQCLFVIAGLALTMGIANAQTGSTVIDQFILTNLEGTYNVNVSETAPLSNVFDVSVTELTSNPALPTPPGAFLDQITFKFFTGTVAVTPAVGVASLSGGTTIPWQSNVLGLGGTTAEFQTVNPAAIVTMGNPFTGTITLMGNPKIVNGSQVQVDLQNTGTGNGVITLSPESSSWLLLLVAVLPLGLIALRRRYAASRMV
jgi:hypothetical protein